jgi:hypothetical protein
MFTVCIFGLDNFSRKNVKQVEYLNKKDYFFDIFTNDRLGDSQLNIPKGNKIYILKKSILSRLLQILGYLIKEYKNITHVEVYNAPIG